MERNKSQSSALFISLTYSKNNNSPQIGYCFTSQFILIIPEYFFLILLEKFCWEEMTEINLLLACKALLLSIKIPFGTKTCSKERTLP